MTDFPGNAELALPNFQTVPGNKLPQEASEASLGLSSDFQPRPGASTCFPTSKGTTEAGSEASILSSPLVPGPHLFPSNKGSQTSLGQAWS